MKSATAPARKLLRALTNLAERGSTPGERETPTPNPAAQALGRLAAGHAKTMTAAAKAQRKAAGIASGKVRSELAAKLRSMV